MQKDFEYWHGLKDSIQKDKRRPFVNERDVWFISLGTNIGFEQDGRGEKLMRPVIVVKKFNLELCWCIPLTRTQKDNNPYFMSFLLGDNGVSSAILSQIRLIDTKRMQYKIGMMPKSDFVEMKKRLQQFLT